ncbi:MAG: glycosyltransferase [Tepidisphaeraceae bacterium]
MPRRILLLITDLEIGGTPTVVRELAIRLTRGTDAHVEVACLAKWGPVATQLREAGIAVHAIGASGPLDLVRVTRDLVRFIHERRFDTVFSFLVHANTIAALASRFCRDVRFQQSIQTTQPKPRWHWKLQAIAHHAAERVVVPSMSAGRAARAWADVPAGKLVVIPNAVDADAFARSPVPALDPRPYPVGFIGRLDPVKRVPMLIEALAGRAARRGDVHLHIFGDGPERPLVEGAIAGLRAESWVTMHGAVPRPQEALSRVGLLVLPSSAEGFGLVLIEAMAAGVPVVAAGVAGVRDVVRHGANGILVDPDAPAMLAGAIDRVIDDSALRAQLVETGLRDARERFGWEGVLGAYARLLGLTVSDRA